MMIGRPARDLPSARMFSSVSRWIGALAAIGVISALPARGIITYGTDDPVHNTTAPAGALAGSGWRWQGPWGGLLGTAISPNHFITVAHAGGATGWDFSLDGKHHTAVSVCIAPGADLQIWKVAGTITSFAPRYTGIAERGKTAVMIGRGTARGEAIMGEGTFRLELKGWRWGGDEGVVRWGTNVVSAVVDSTGNMVTGRAGLAGDRIRCTFDAGAGADEATISRGDSGGALFIQDAGDWKLAGLLSAVEGTIRLSADGPDVSAAIFDLGGLYVPTTGGWVKFPDQFAQQPTSFSAARVSGNEAWIASVLADQVAPDRVMTVESSAAADGPFTEEKEARLQLQQSLFVVPTAAGTRFYRLRSDAPTTISGVSLSAEGVVLRFGME